MLIDTPDSIGTEFVLWRRDRKIAMPGDGYALDDGCSNPDAELPIAERKEHAKKGLGTAPETAVCFRLADDRNLVIFKFIQRSAWSLEPGAWSLTSRVTASTTTRRLGRLGRPGRRRAEARAGQLHREARTPPASSCTSRKPS